MFNRKYIADRLHSSRPQFQITSVKKSTIKVTCHDLLSELHVIKLSLISIMAMSSLPELTFVGLRLYWSLELSWYKEINRTIEGGVQHSLVVTQTFNRINMYILIFCEVMNYLRKLI